MYRYAYDNCPVCGLTFTDNDDVVVCPECGTPHHRSCYNNFGGCANAEKHSEGFTFSSSTPSAAEENTKSSSAETSYHTQNTAADNSASDSADSSSAPFGNIISDSDKIEGVPVGDLKKYIGSAWMYYIPLFLAKVKGMRIFRINFSAFIGSYMWLLARKFYLYGFISGLLVLLSNLYMDFYVVYAKNAGINLMDVSTFLEAEDPKIMIGYYAYMLASNIPLILSVLTGIFANKLYMKKSINAVKKINKESKTAEEFNKQLSKKGGLNMPLLYTTFAVMVSYLILTERGIIANLMQKLIDII